VKSEIFGEVTIPWASVAGLSSETDVTVTTTGGESLTGPVVSVGTDVQVSTLAGAKTLPLATVSSIRGTEEQHAWERLQNPGWLQLWQGNFDMGLALARGNARTDTLTTTFQATRATRVDKLTTHFNQIYGTARINGVTGAIANAVRGGWAYDRNVAGRLFLSTLNDYEHDRFQNLDLRFVLGTGLGVNAIKRENATSARVFWTTCAATRPKPISAMTWHTGSRRSRRSPNRSAHL
jgi:hypothetical protein